MKEEKKSYQEIISGFLSQIIRGESPHKRRFKVDNKETIEEIQGNLLRVIEDLYLEYFGLSQIGVTVQIKKTFVAIVFTRVEEFCYFTVVIITKNK